MDTQANLIGKRVRVIAYDIPEKDRINKTGGGVKTHYGIVKNIVKDIFDGRELFIIQIKDKIQTYTEQSIVK